MKKKEFRGMLLVVIAALLGGAASNLVRVGPVFAQKKTAQFSSSVKAENFELVDKQGRTRAKLTMGTDDEPMLVAYDTNGKATAAYGLNANGGPVQNLLDRILGP